jgi:acyl-CoA thioester hydrolase
MTEKYLDVEFRVRYFETDRMGRVHHTHYLTYFEVGRSAFCRHTGMSYNDIESAGYYLVVSEAYVRYRSSVSYDELVKVRTHLVQANKRKFIFGYQLLDGSEERILAEGETHHIVTDLEGKPQALPAELLNYYKPFLS